MATLVSVGMLFLISTTLLVALPSEFRSGEVRVHHGAVASDDERCSVVGKNILVREGGHAVDAAVGVSFCEGVVRPVASGIGGGGFIIIKQAGEEPVAIDMREFAPGTASEDMYHGNLTMKFQGMQSIAVPGQLKGLYEMWRRYGRIPWRFLVFPAEDRARSGFTISENMYEMMELYQEAIMNDPGLKSVFAPNGELLTPGQICKNVKLADTLKQIALYGPNVFYHGKVGQNLIADIQSAGGNLTMDDLNRYNVIINKPISTNVLGLKLYGVPPPASGAASMFLILNILNQYGFPLFIPPGLEAHRRVEAIKHAFAVRMNLGDPDFVNITAVLDDMLSPEFAAELKQTIDDNRTFSPPHYGGKWNLWHLGKEDGTTHFSVVDKYRNAVGITTTINYYFGSGYLSPNTGIILNNHMDDFSIPLNCTSLNCTFLNSSCSCTPSDNNCTCCDDLPPAPANFILPYKRPMSAAAPLIIMEGDNLRGVIGASGGPRIIGATTEVLLNYFVAKMGAYDSVREPRYYDPLIPTQVQYENMTTEGLTFLVPQNIRDGWVARGHKIATMTSEPGVCQFIAQEFEGKLPNPEGVLVAVSDPRYGGRPAGY